MRVAHSLFRILRRSKLKHFVRDVVFVCLSFKMRFRLTVWFRQNFQHAGLDRHFGFFCGPFLGNHLNWIFDGRLSAQYPNEVAFYLLESGYRREALTLFRRLDWTVDNALMSQALDGTGIVGDGYSMDLLTADLRLGTVRISSPNRGSSAFSCG